MSIILTRMAKSKDFCIINPLKYEIPMVAVIVPKMMEIVNKNGYIAVRMFLISADSPRPIHRH